MNADGDFEQHLQRFDLPSFRSGQRAVIETVFAGEDCLCIMPTGGGKSLCYQLPAVAREGTTLVVSPLIALMKDQVDSLTQRNIPATFINSSLDYGEQQARINGMARGEYELVYIAPERMRSRAFVEALEHTKVQLLAIDEAHCISQWGHDFRPDYARLGRLREAIGSPQTIALTATATATVRQDICDVLQLKEPRIFITGFARDNLSLSVSHPSSNSDKDRMLEEFIKSNPGGGIVYCSTRKACDHLTELLKKKLRKRKVAVYHAGLESNERRDIQEAFSKDKIDIIVATNAFGMGIDKSNLRFVVHYNLPGSIEAYYQEAGRAGRDGKPSRCQMLYSYQDRFIQEFFIENSYPSPEVVKEVYRYLCSLKTDPIELTLHELKEELNVSTGTEGVRVSETLLQKSGALERLDTQQNMASVKITSELATIVDMLPRDARKRRHVLRGVESRVGPLRDERVFFPPGELCKELEMTWDKVQTHLRDLNKLDCFDYVPPFRGRAIHIVKRVPYSKLEIDFKELDERKREELKRLESVLRLANSGTCRQMEILQYFGDPNRQPCRICDNCGGLSAERVAVTVETVEANNGCLYAMQVALSGVARTRGRYGKTLIAQMLCGSASQKMKKLGLTKISTYGLLKQLNQSVAIELMDSLVNAQLISISEQQKFRPLVNITDRGTDVMKGLRIGDALSIVPEKLARRLNSIFRSKRPNLSESLLASAVAAEKDLDDEEVESEVVDSTAVAGVEEEVSVASDEPKVDESVAEPAGPTLDIGPEIDAGGQRSLLSRLDKVDDSESESVGETTTTEPPKLIVHPTYYWTWKLFSLGFTMLEVSQIRGRTPQQLAAHLELAEENSLPVDKAWTTVLQSSN